MGGSARRWKRCTRSARASSLSVLAMHFEQAGDAERAIEYYVAGAKHALGQYAIQEAYGAFDRAASLIAEEEAAPAAVELSADEANRRRRRRIEVDLGRAEAGYSIRTPEETFDALERIVEPAEQLGDLELIGRVHTLIALQRLLNGESATEPIVKRSLDRVAEVGKSIGDASLRRDATRTHRARAMSSLAMFGWAPPSWKRPFR